LLTKKTVTKNWYETGSPYPYNSRMWKHKTIPLYVIWSIATTNIGSRWHHLQITHNDRIPSYDDLIKVKNEFLGYEIEAYQVLPKKSDYVNICDKCLHIWSPLSERECVVNLKDLINEEPP